MLDTMKNSCLSWTVNLFYPICAIHICAFRYVFGWAAYQPAVPHKNVRLANVIHASSLQCFPQI